MDATTPSPDRIELSTLVRDDATGLIVHRTLTDDAVKLLIDVIQQEEEAAQKKAEAAAGDI